MAQDDEPACCGPITIDREGCLAPDDAIMATANPDGTTLLEVFIADLTQVVKLGDSLDQFAADMVFSRYWEHPKRFLFCDPVVEEYTSLVADEPRMAVAISVLLDEFLQVREMNIDRREITTRAQLSCHQASDILKDPSHPLHGQLSLLKNLALNLMEYRRHRGALAIYDMQKGWLLTENGQLVKPAWNSETIGNLIVQESMIVANQAVARMMVMAGVPMLFRNHQANFGPPGSIELRHSFAQEFADPQALDSAQLEQRATVLMGRAHYWPEVCGHWALNMDEYGHASSVLWRYPDGVNQRQLIAVVENQPVPYSLRELKQIADKANRTEAMLRNWH